MHEHSRPDRDSHVSILLGNVQPGQEHNFKAVSTGTHSGRGTPFDPNSQYLLKYKKFIILIHDLFNEKNAQFKYYEKLTNFF